MRVFLDTSALVKRYIGEFGTDQVLLCCDRATELAIAVIAVPETVSAFRRLVREDRISEAQYTMLKADLRADLADVWLCEVSPLVVQRAIEALEAHPLRALDALHIGAALVVGAELFVSADRVQCAAATHSGLQVLAL